jgi:hypothetical protein
VVLQLLELHQLSPERGSSCEIEEPPAEAGGVLKALGVVVCSCEIEEPPAEAGGVSD